MRAVLAAACAAGVVAIVIVRLRRKKTASHSGPKSAVGVVGMGVMGSQVDKNTRLLLQDCVCVLLRVCGCVRRRC